MVETPQGTAPSAQFCQQVRDEFGLSMTVLYDPMQQMEAYGTNDLAVVLDSEGQILFKAKYATSQAMDIVDQELNN